MKIARRLMASVLGKRLPSYSGTLRVDGLHDTLVIRRDAFGVPYLSARNAHDAWFGLGFCHAQDRGGQLELLVRAVRGTLAEIIGDDGLAIDRLSRRIGFLRAGVAQLAVAEVAVRAQFEAYAAGINAAFARGLPKPPHEHALLNCAPSQWRGADVQGYCALLCFALASNWDMELQRLHILQRDGAEALKALDLHYPARLPVTHPPGTSAGRAVSPAVPAPTHNEAVLLAELERFGEMFGRPRGSNAWAVAGRRSVTGKPILASDPHLPANTPPLVYLAQVRCPEFEAAGGTFVGIPGYVPGHNGFACWGATAAHADNTDLFIEELSEDGLSVRDGDDWTRCEVREEIIRGKDGSEHVERVLITPRGPVISPALETEVIPGPRFVLSLAATWLAERPYTGFLRAHDAKSPEQFHELFRAGSTSTVNTLYADADDHIAWQLAVELPQRREQAGLIPMPGWDPRVGWEREPVPFESMPRCIDPPQGYLASANNQPVSDAWEGPFLGVDWLDGYRQLRLDETLSTRSDWDVAATALLQLDTETLVWREIAERILALEPDDRDSELALSMLREWDGRLTSNSSGAAVYALFMADMACRVVRDKAPHSSAWALGHGMTTMIPHTTIATRRMAHLAQLINDSPNSFFGGEWEQPLLEALRRSVQQLRENHGDAPSAWHWGKVRPLTLVHAFAQQKPFDRIFNIGPLDGEGDCTTLAQGGLDYLDPTSNQLWLPVLRTVFDTNDWEACRYSLAGGQSGNPLSPHYDDQLCAWRSGRGIPIAWSESRILERATKCLTLTPA